MSATPPLTSAQFAEITDITLLAPGTTRAELKKLAADATRYNFGHVCVTSANVGHMADLLRGKVPKVIAVVGFPHANVIVDSLKSEVWDADGAEEIDMVVNAGNVKDDRTDLVRTAILAVVDAALGRPVKVILETCLLTSEQIVAVCRIAQEAGAAFVKTSTGFGKAGATIEHVALMRKTVGLEMGVKASGGIRTLEQAQAMVNAGASRLGIGQAAAVEIMQELLWNEGLMQAMTAQVI